MNCNPPSKERTLGTRLPSKLKFLLGRHLATNSFASGKLFYKSGRRLQNVRCHSDQNGHNLEGWIDPFFRLNEKHFTFHLQYKHSGMFAKRKYEALSYPKQSENVRPHSRNSIENATPSSATSPLASRKEVHPQGCWSQFLERDVFTEL